MPYLFFDPYFLLFIAPALLLGLFAQWWVSSAYRRAAQISARLNGFGAARKILDSAGLYNVEIEQTHGHLSDHYDPRSKVLRLSQDVYHNYTMASVGIAAHEAGHALQDAGGYIPFVIRNAAVPLAGIGSNVGVLLLILGMAFSGPRGTGFGYYMAIAGLALFGCVVVFQLVNLPVEFNASARAKRQLVDLGIVDDQEMGYVRTVLTAAALTYVAATLQSVLTLLYYALRVFGGRRSE